MARKRAKPVAEQTEATARPGSEPNSTEVARPEPPAAEHTAPPEPDIFDRIIAARAAGQFEKPQPPTATDTAARVEAALAAAPVVRGRELAGPAGEAAHSERPAPAAPRTPVLHKTGDRLPDPRGIARISLDADARNGPTMRLLRSHRHRDVWIQFDQNPGKQITDQVKAEGFRWEPRAEAGDRTGAWVKPLEPGREIRIMLDAERLFLDLGNQIRESKGLEPVGRVGQGAS